MDSSPLSRLPSELRLTLYELACPYSTESVELKIKDLNKHTAILRTCKELRREAKAIFDTNNITKITLQFDPGFFSEQSDAVIANLRRVLLVGRLKNLTTIDCSYDPGEAAVAVGFCLLDVRRNFYAPSSKNPTRLARACDGPWVYRLEGTINRDCH